MKSFLSPGLYAAWQRLVRPSVCRRGFSFFLWRSVENPLIIPALLLAAAAIATLLKLTYVGWFAAATTARAVPWLLVAWFWLCGWQPGIRAERKGGIAGDGDWKIREHIVRKQPIIRFASWSHLFRCKWQAFISDTWSRILVVLSSHLQFLPKEYSFNMCLWMNMPDGRPISYSSIHHYCYCILPLPNFHHFHCLHIQCDTFFFIALYLPLYPRSLACHIWFYWLGSKLTGTTIVSYIPLRANFKTICCFLGFS